MACTCVIVAFACYDQHHLISRMEIHVPYEPNQLYVMWRKHELLGDADKPRVCNPKFVMSPAARDGLGISSTGQAGVTSVGCTCVHGSRYI